MKSKGAIRGKNARAFAERAKKKDWTESIRTYLLPEIKPNKSMKVVDFCTGSGNIIPFFESEVKEFIAIDASEEMINILKENFSRVKNLRIIQSDVSKVPLGSAVYDTVISKFSFHHISDLYPVIREARRILKKGGRLFVIDCIFEGSWFDRVKIPFFKIRNTFKHGSHELFCRYRDDKQMTDLFVKSNFKLIKKKRIGPFGKSGCLEDYMYVLQKV